jgi:hypothetical protein
MPATYGDLSIDESFPRSYEVEWLVDMPNSPSLERHFLNPAPHGDGAGPILRVSGERNRFIAVVGGSHKNLRITTWPNPWCFLALPSAILVNAREPDLSAQLEGFEGHTVHYKVPLADRGLILIGHCCAMYCYNAEGLLWSLEEAFCCEDPVIDVAGDDLVLTAHKHGVDPGETPTRKTFELLTGHKR